MQAYMTLRGLIEIASRDWRPLLEEIEIFELVNAPRELAYSDTIVYLT